MKTKGLTFLEAVQALHDGKCKKIVNPQGTQYLLKNGGVSVDFGRGIELTPENFLGEWELIRVKQKVVFENVLWFKSRSDSLIYPIMDGCIMDRFLDKPRMKMTLEWEE